MWYPFRGDVDLDTRLWISAVPRVPDMDIERAESAYLNPLASTQRPNHAVEDDFEHLSRFLERNSCGFSNLQFEFCFG